MNKVITIAHVSFVAMWIFIFIAIAMYFFYFDAVAITAPPWDHCGFTHNHIGKAFTCIAFDSDVVIIK